MMRIVLLLVLLGLGEGVYLKLRRRYRCPMCYAWWNHNHRKSIRPRMNKPMVACRNCGRQF